MDSINSRAPRVSLVNVSTGEEMKCLFNPEQLVEKLQVNWNRLDVPGLSHQPLQFKNTSNSQLSGIEFYFDWFFANTNKQSPYAIEEFRKFLWALTVPVKSSGGVAATCPPQTMVIWPGVLTALCVVSDVTFTFKKFSIVDGAFLVYTASVNFERVIERRLTSEKARKDA